MKAIILDMDGVIIDSEPTHFRIERNLLKELGGYITDKEQDKFVGTTDNYMWSTFKKQFDIPLSVEKMMEMKKERFYKEIKNIPLVPYFKEMLSLFKENDYKIALASSNNRKAVEKVIEKFKLESNLDFYISGNDVINGKPDPEIFLKASDALDIEPEKCLVIEDAKSGTIAAKKANMICVGYQNPNSGDQDLSEADLIIHSLNELNIEVLESLFRKQT